MITVRESVFILYDTENEVNVERVKLDVGTAADLPSADFLPGRRLYQGSTAHDISTGDLYAIDSTGTWYKQNRAGGGGGSAILIEKTISENGTYNATDDEADGYSKVVVDVAPGFNTWELEYDTIIVHSNDGIYDVSPFTYANIILSEPVVKILKTASNPMTTATIKFTPAENYDGIYKDNGTTPETYTGDTAIAGDGKQYDFKRNLVSGHTLTKRNGNFIITIT